MKSAFLVALERIFSDGVQLVFWNDAQSEFSSMVDGITIEGVKILRLDRTPALQAKLWLEQSAGQRWLIYSGVEIPSVESDWLLDARLRGKVFSADIASMQLDELGLSSRVLIGHLKLRGEFLNARDRIERLGRLVEPDDTSDVVDRKMLAVLVRAETHDAAGIYLRIFSALATEVDGLGGMPKAVRDIGSYDLLDAFWKLADAEFGYREAGCYVPTLRGLLYHILATDFCSGLEGDIPAPLSHFVVKDRQRSAHVSVFASRWRSDIANFASYDKLSGIVADELHVPTLLGPMTAERLLNVLTFEAVEKRVIADLKARIISGGGANMDAVRKLMARRRDGHWANPLLAGTNPSIRALSASYDALEAAASFFELKAKHGQGFSFSSAKVAFDSYRTDLFRFDQLYRAFMRANELVEPMGWSLLHELRARMEDAYSGWFVGQLASAWDTVVGGPNGLLKSWAVDEVHNQQRFYERHVAPAFDGGAKRVFVVISDAFRYEAADELARELNSRNRVKAKLDAMLGVLPSYTTLGMASLLPHKRLAYKANAALDVLVDGQPSASLDQRSAILAGHGGIAIGRDDLMEKGKDKGREFVKPHRLIYVYHDHIDAIGDKRGTEGKTFEATEQAIRELSELVSFIVNNLNGSTIFVTADHGFLYQESELEEADRATVEEGMPGVLKHKKRYILGRGMWPMSNAWSGNTATTAGTDAGDGSLDFLVPKGAGRFHFVGGARFVHGSAMPQEIVVPMIAVKEGDADKTRTRSVEVSLLGSTHRIVTNKQRFAFIQTEAVSERVLAVTLLVSIRDGDVAVSDEQALTFDTKSDLADERKRTTMLTIQAGTYDRDKDYFLVARDAKTKAEVSRSTMRIDLAFSNDF